MSYYLLLQNKVIAEGDTIEAYREGMASLNLKVLKIDPKLQQFEAALDGNDNLKVTVPINDWSGASIVKKEEISDPNIKFKLSRGHNDGQ
jgi:C4-type Zn-finger protein